MSVGRLMATLADIRRRLAAGVYTDTDRVTQGIVLPVLNDLGWPVFDPAVVVPAYAVGDRVVDYALLGAQSSPAVILQIEEQRPLLGDGARLLPRVQPERVTILAVTNGPEWELFLTGAKPTERPELFHAVDLRNGGIEEVATDLLGYLGCGVVRSGDAARRAARNRKEAQKRRRAVEAIPTAWNELVNEGSERLLILLASRVEQLCAVRPDREDLLRFLRSLGPRREDGAPPGTTPMEIDVEEVAPPEAPTAPETEERAPAPTPAETQSDAPVEARPPSETEEVESGDDDLTPGERALRREIRSIGMACFVKYFERSEEPDIEDRMCSMEGFTRDSCRRRLYGIRRIQRAGFGERALEIVVASAARRRTRDAAAALLTGSRPRSGPERPAPPAERGRAPLPQDRTRPRLPPPNRPFRDPPPAAAARRSGRRASRGSWEMDGVRHECPRQWEVVREVFAELQRRDRSFLPAFARRYGADKRPIVLRDRRAAYPFSPGLRNHLAPLPDGWWLAHHSNREMKEQWLKLACEVAGLRWGRDLIVEL